MLILMENILPEKLKKLAIEMLITCIFLKANTVSYTHLQVLNLQGFSCFMQKKGAIAVADLIGQLCDSPVCRAYVHAAVECSLLLFILKLGRSLFKESLHTFFLILSTEAASEGFCLKGTAGEHIKMISLVDTCLCHSYGYRSL